jgi:hypothetical protein
MDKGHPRSAWPPHSYKNISNMQEHYESVVPEFEDDRYTILEVSVGKKSE